MGDGERLLRCFRESPTGILQLIEIEERNGERSVQHLLQEMVDGGVLGCRVIKTNESQHTVYWVKRKSLAPTTTITNATCSQTPSRMDKVPTPMSASLRERLKRSRPRFVSPLLSTAKKPRISAPRIDVVVGKLDFSEGDTKTAESSSSQEKGSSVAEEGGEQLTPSSQQNSKEGGEQLTPSSQQKSKEGGEQLRMLVAEKTALQRELEEAQERLRKLKMVKIYRSKNDLQRLDSLIRKWREVSQEAIQDLLRSSTHNPPPTTHQMLNYLHIDHTLVHYSIEDEAFY